jgi:hypothetical protein
MTLSITLKNRHSALQIVALVTMGHSVLKLVTLGYMTLGITLKK